MSIHRNSTKRDNFQNARLLIIEDNQDHGTVINEAIRQCLPEVKPVLVTNEVQALTFLNQSKLEEWEFPKLILLDLYVPERQNGWNLLEQIRALPNTLSKTPIVLLSSSDCPGDIAEAYRRGCSSYLVKPTQFVDWVAYFKALRLYWWETVALPKAGISLD